jgi:hypothetical protein
MSCPYYKERGDLKEKQRPLLGASYMALLYSQFVGISVIFTSSAKRTTTSAKGTFLVSLLLYS